MPSDPTVSSTPAAALPKSEPETTPGRPRNTWPRLTLLGALLLIAIAIAVRHFRPVSAADFRLPDLTGKTLRLHDQRGKVVLLNFWATWCAACLTELPDLQRLSPLSQTHPFVLWTVNLQEHPSGRGAFHADVPSGLPGAPG